MRKLLLISALLFSFNGWAYSETDQEKLKAQMEREDLEYAQALRQQQMELDQMIDEDDAEVTEDKQSENTPREPGARSASERLSDLFYFLYENMTLKNSGLVILYLLLWAYLNSAEWLAKGEALKYETNKKRKAYLQQKVNEDGRAEKMLTMPFEILKKIMNIAGALFGFYLLYLLIVSGYHLISGLYPNHYVNASVEDPYGFVSGLIHGLFILLELLIIAFSWILSKFDINLLRDFTFIGKPNTGFGYGIGYLFGVVTYILFSDIKTLFVTQSPKQNQERDTLTK